MRKKKKQPQIHSIEQLQTEAANFLIAEHYKEAIDAYKQLLKKEQREEWQVALTNAYLERAKVLANKGMYKEAAVLWENRANLCKDKKLFDQYILWLIQGGHHIKATRLFTDSAEQLPEEIKRQLQAQFGALLVAGYQEVAEGFSEDAPFLKQYVQIEEALKSYYQGDDKATEEALKKIPFRSPYRDFRTILKALLIINSEPNTAHQLLNKVPKESPYAHFAELILLYMQQDSEIFLETFGKLNSHEQAFIANLKGWDKNQFKVISTLQTAVKRDSYKALMEVVIDNRRSFGDTYSRQFCFALLPSYPAGIKLYERTFGPLSKIEKFRISALNIERQEEPYQARNHWLICVDELEQDSKTKDNALKAALILRHLVEIAERGGDFEDEAVAEDLANSIALDPEDKASYQKLIKWYKQHDDQKGYQKWVDAAVKQFSKNNEILFIAMEAATQKKAFKKAVGFAKKLLKVDPINIKARQIAQASHISHARKLIKSERFDLARKELTEAISFEKSSQRSGIVQINQGLLELQIEGFVKPKSKSKKIAKPTAKIKGSKGIRLLQEGLQLAGSNVLGKFRLIVESQSQNLDPNNILSLVSKFEKDTLLTRQEVLDLVNLINAYSEEGVTFITDAINQVKATFQKAIKLDTFSYEDMLSLCECFKKAAHYELLKQFADDALKRWSQHGAFFYYQVYAKAQGSIYHVSMPDMERLKESVEKAEQRGDKRTAVMIISFLSKLRGPLVESPIRLPPFFDLDFDDDDDDDDDYSDFEEKLERLNNLNPDEMSPMDVIKIIKRLEEMKDDLGIEIPELNDFPFPQPPSRKKNKRNK
ncbi:hypothetical protein [Candidatus Parabeggiatoa sp. HSG14]|uniref:tetratricopeptide repeat protein n=1 Tax=Candidatus Parabeggiatoa sp. HSG14 TaxID=3055593 RepID=UPI0025A81C25|nr:hypothetical protein [Thiotrichales bacterium HSG14]